jgi:hypothetical protein
MCSRYQRLCILYFNILLKFRIVLANELEIAEHLLAQVRSLRLKQLNVF